MFKSPLPLLSLLERLAHSAHLDANEVACSNQRRLKPKMVPDVLVVSVQTPICFGCCGASFGLVSGTNWDMVNNSAIQFELGSHQKLSQARDIKWTNVDIFHAQMSKRTEMRDKRGVQHAVVSLVLRAGRRWRRRPMSTREMKF